MADLQKVQSGEKFAPKAADYNAFIDAALANRMNQTRGVSGKLQRNLSGGIIPVRNDTGADQNLFAVLSLSTILITPTDNLNEFSFRPNLFSGVALASGNLSNPFVIMQEPLKNASIGSGMVVGATPAQITVSDESHGFAILATTGLVSAASGIARILWKESGTGAKWAVISLPSSAGGGSSSAGAVPCKITSNTNAPEYTVDVYANGKYGSATASGATLYILDISFCDVLPVDTWVLGNTINLQITG